MSSQRLLLPALGLLALGGTALADSEPGSLLLFPSFDSRIASSTLLTVTNTNDDQANGTVDIEWIYIDGETCLEFNRTHTLTANDTLTVVAKAHNPVQQLGYLYVFAKSPTTGQAITWNWLIGNMIDIDALVLFDWSINPVSYQGLTGQGNATDVSPANGLRDLNGQEYSRAGAEVLIPRFLGQSSVFRSELILVNLSGGSRFDAVIDFQIYNDNEEAFSAQYQFNCWDYVDLTDISNVFENDYLHDTNDAENEILGASNQESGWMRLDGNVAFSTAHSIPDPAFVAVLAEEFRVVAVTFGAADLPFFNGRQANGALLSHSIFGN
jgi:hypothetical protein